MNGRRILLLGGPARPRGEAELLGGSVRHRHGAVRTGAPTRYTPDRVPRGWSKSYRRKIADDFLLLQSRMPLMRSLTLTPIAYDPELLTQWKKGDYSLLDRSKASPSIQKVLKLKAQKRPGRRFFGEAVVAAEVQHKAGWYSSFKWLTADCWLEENGTQSSAFRTDFASALAKHITRPVLQTMRKKADRLKRRLDGRIPAPPDLWLITGRTHRFIEVKLPRDRVSDRQLAGFAILATSLNPSMPFALAAAELHAEGVKPTDERGGHAAQERFETFCAMLDGRRAMRRLTWESDHPGHPRIRGPGGGSGELRPEMRTRKRHCRAG